MFARLATTYDNEVTVSQIDKDVKGASLPATLCLGRHAVIPQGLGKKDIDASLANGLRIILSNRHR